MSSLPPSFHVLVCNSVSDIEMEPRAGSPPLVIPTAPSRAIPALLVVRQMFLPPPTGSSRPPTSNTKKGSEEVVRKSGVWSRHIWSSNRRVGFSTKLVGKLTAMLRLLTVRRIVSQKVQLLKIYTSELPAFMQFSMFVEFHLTSIYIRIKAEE